MAAAYRSVSTVAFTTHTNTTFPAPSGIVNGDILLMFLGFSGANPTTTLPTGFQLLTGYPSSTSGLTLRVAYKVALNESGSYVTTHTNVGSSGIMVCISGGQSTTPASTLNTGSGATATALSLTTARNGSCIVFFDFQGSGFGGAVPPTGTTPTFTFRATEVLFYVATGDWSSSGATGNKTQATAGGTWQSGLVAIESPSVVPQIMHNRMDQGMS